jgi:hypothetical protein
LQAKKKTVKQAKKKERKIAEMAVKWLLFCIDAILFW